MLICSACGIEFPATDSLHRAFVQSKANASDHSNLRRLSVGSNQHAQRHRTLHLCVSGFVRIDRVRANDARWRQNSPRVRQVALTLATARSLAISHASIFPRADSSVTSPAGLGLVEHPRKA